MTHPDDSVVFRGTEKPAGPRSHLPLLTAPHRHGRTGEEALRAVHMSSDAVRLAIGEQTVLPLTTPSLDTTTTYC